MRPGLHCYLDGTLLNFNPAQSMDEAMICLGTAVLIREALGTVDEDAEMVVVEVGTHRLIFAGVIGP